LKVGARIASLEIGHTGKGNEAAIEEVRCVWCLVAVDIRSELDGVPPSHPGNGIQVLESVLCAPLGNDKGFPKIIQAHDGYRWSERKGAIRRKAWVAPAKGKPELISDVASEDGGITKRKCSRGYRVRSAETGQIGKHERQTWTGSLKGILAVLYGHRILTTPKQWDDARRP